MVQRWGWFINDGIIGKTKEEVKIVKLSYFKAKTFKPFVAHLL